MSDVGCQLDRICIHLGGKPLGMPVRVSLDSIRLTEVGGPPNLDVGGTILWPGIQIT